MQLRTFRLNFAPGPELPKRLLVAKWGVNKSVLGDYIVNETTARELPKNHRKANFDTIDLDFNHNTVPGSPAYRAEKEPRKRAACGTLEVVKGEGIYLHTADRWTPEGAEAAKGGHYSDLSPAIVVNKQNEVVCMHSVALARQGATEDLPLQLNSSDPLFALFKDDETTPAMLDYKKLLLSVLDLPDTANDAQITEKVKTECGADADDTPTGVVKTMNAKFELLLAEVTNLKKSDEKNAKDAIAARALAAGKIIPHSVMELPLTHFEAVVAELPADQVPLEKRTPANVQTHSSDVLRGSAASADEEVRKNLGISEDAWNKHAKA